MAKKALSVAEQLAKLAASMGMKMPDNIVQQPTIRREADAVILYVEDRNKFVQKECKWCHSRFAANYECVAMCSDACRIKWLAEIGIEWNPGKSQDERWAKKIPLVVPQAALDLLDTHETPAQELISAP